MCKITKAKFHSTMDGNKFQENYHSKSSNLLGLAAADDVSGFINMVEEKGVSVDDVSFWYGRRNGRKMGLELRTPLMIASMYGSIHVLKYIIDTNKVDVNRSSDSDGATALHCAAAGGSPMSVGVVKLLVQASADVNLTDGYGNKAGDLIARGIKSSTRRDLEMLLKGFSIEEEQIEEKEIVSGRKEYPIDVSMPDINTGVYGSDEFRMYTFKVKPCSRAYTHDWTECPFVHPGENARRRDVKKFNYSCVPCPEFRKGSCRKGDLCEYAHGVFESWLHPAQYKTRLCKEETLCARKVCFFAHRAEELRPVYAYTGSALPSPKSASTEIGSNPNPTMSMSPPASPIWQNNMNHSTPPALQLSGSRLKTSLNARDLSNVFGSPDRSLLSPLQGVSSPTGYQQFRQNSNALRASYPSPNHSYSPVRKPTSYGFDSSAAVALAVMNSRSSSLKQRSHSFIDRAGSAMSPRSIPQQTSSFSEWGSRDGKLEWGFSGEDASKLRKSASFGYGGGAGVNVNHEPDVSWVNTLVKDVGVGLNSSQGMYEKLPQWIEQMYIEQEQMVA